MKGGIPTKHLVLIAIGVGFVALLIATISGMIEATYMDALADATD